MDDSSSGAASDVGLKQVLDRMSDGVFAVDDEWYVTYANETAREILRSAMADDVLDDVDDIDGLHLWEAIPDAVDTPFYDEYHQALSSQTPVSFEEYYSPLDIWFDVRIFPSDSGLSVYVRDITEQQRLKQQRQESLTALQKLYAVSSERDRDFASKAREILRLGREYLGVDNGFLTRIEQGTQYIELSDAAHAKLQPGESCPLDEAYCKRTIQFDELLTVVNAADEGWEEDPAYDRFSLGTYVGGRIEVDGDLYGTLCFADVDGRSEPFSDTQRTFVELLTRWISYELERKRARTQLQRERDRLEEFASVVSHDLRNPLQTATGRAELLAEAVDNDHLPPLQRALDRMDALIDDLLTLARDGTEVEEMEEVDLATLADEAWEMSREADASLDIESRNLRIRADESRVRQLLENLFRNSIDHAGDGVTVTLGPLPSGFYVADDGPGIPADEREQVFDAGYSTAEAGIGFGLSIVEEIAAAHGWTVSVTDAAGGGARFEITGVDVVTE